MSMIGYTQIWHSWLLKISVNQETKSKWESIDFFKLIAENGSSLMYKHLLKINNSVEKFYVEVKIC